MSEKNKNFKDLDIENNFNEWYNTVVREAELVDIRYNIKGFVVYRPLAVYTISKMFNMYEDILTQSAHQQVMLPSLIPESNFLKEAEHVEGFAPEVMWVTEHGNSKKLEERYAQRPTSETAFYSMFKYWLKSYRDLPMKRFQRAEIYRYETKATKPFLRSREFYWFETHNLFETLEDANNQVLQDMEITQEMLHRNFAIPFVFFRRPQWDKFAGALDTFAADTILPNGKVLQLPSTHLLGDKFSKAFDVKYKDRDENYKYPFSTCYGPAISRIFGGMIGVLGDNLGIRMPFELARTQIIITPLYFKDVDVEDLEQMSLNIAEDLDKLGYRVKIDDQKERKPKERFSYYELRGIPIRIEIGPKDLENNTVIIFRRDLNKKEVVNISDICDTVDNIATDFTNNLREEVDLRFKQKIISVDTLKDLKANLDKGKVIRVPFCSIDMDAQSCADNIKAETNGGEVRGTRIDIDEKPTEDEKCVFCGKKAKEYVYVAKSY
jgi:prolyl-tRNA synthetase